MTGCIEKSPINFVRYTRRTEAALTMGGYWNNIHGDGFVQLTEATLKMGGY